MTHKGIKHSTLFGGFCVLYLCFGSYWFLVIVYVCSSELLNDFILLYTCYPYMHLYLTKSRRHIAEKLLNWCYTTITHLYRKVLINLKILKICICINTVSDRLTQTIAM